MTDQLDAGPFAAWWTDARHAIAGTGESDVPCGSCTACCTSSQFVHIAPDETASLAHIPAEVLFPAPGAPPGHVLMGYDQHGRCPMLVDDVCSIYEYRPRTCRAYDCRVFAATGIAVDDDTKSGIDERVRRWRFRFPTGDDDDTRAAVAAAVDHLGEHSEELPVELRPRTSTQAAVLAVEASVAFLGPIDAAGRRSVLEPTTDELVGSIRAGRATPDRTDR